MKNKANRAVKILQRALRLASKRRIIYYEERREMLDAKKEDKNDHD